MAKKKEEKALNIDTILFNCRDHLRAARNSGSFFEKRDMMLTLVFLRFIGEKYEDGIEKLRQTLIEQGLDPEDENIRAAFFDDATFADGTYNLPHEARWSTIINTPAPGLNVALDTALQRLEEEDPQLKGCFIKGTFTARNLAPNDINNKGLGRGKDNTLIDFDEKYDEYIDKTLGALIHFIKLKKKDGTFKNGNMFCVDESTLQCIIDVLYDFKDVERNDRLHQHNLYTKEAVEEIRNQAFLLYYLLLGSFDLTPKYLSDLGLNANNEKGKVIDEDVLEKQIIEWVTPIVKFDVPQNADVIAFNITKFQGKPWHLALQALGETDYEKYSTIEWNHNMVYTSTITNNVIEWNSEEAWIDGVDKLKRIINKLLENTDISGRLKTYSEVLLGSTEFIDTMYKK